jgi:hypothetical protein
VLESALRVVFLRVNLLFFERRFNVVFPFGFLGFVERVNLLFFERRFLFGVVFTF